MKTNLDKFFKTKSQAVWFALDEETKFLVKPYSEENTAVRAMLAKHYRPYQRQIDAGTLPAKKGLEITAKIFVAACLEDWKNVEIDGKMVPFSREVAIQLFNRLPELLKTLTSYAQDFRNFQDPDVDEEEFNEEGEKVDTLGNS